MSYTTNITICCESNTVGTATGHTALYQRTLKTAARLNLNKLYVRLTVHFKINESKQDLLDATDSGLFHQLYHNMFRASLRPSSGE
jgi:hypothetical protein